MWIAEVWLGLRTFDPRRDECGPARLDRVPRPNDAVAGMLREYAELLAISGGDAFKVRAYEKAARAVEGYPVDVAELGTAGLDAIPSVGARIARKIREFLDTGAVTELVEMRARVPAGLRALLTVPGLGPKRAHQVYHELGITSTEELLDSLHQHRLRELPGWGAKSEDNLAESLRQAHSAADRVQLGYALELAPTPRCADPRCARRCDVPWLCPGPRWPFAACAFRILG